MRDPAAVAEAFLDASRTLAKVGREGMHDAGARAAFTAAKTHIQEIADYAAIAELYPLPSNRDADARQRRRWAEKIVSDWPSMIAHYAGSIRPGPIRVEEARTAARNIAVSQLAERVAIVRADPPKREAERLDALRREAAEATDLRGRRLTPGTSAFSDWVRQKAVAEGIAPSAGAAIYIGLHQSADQWRIVSVAVEPLPLTARTAAASARPSAATQAAQAAGPPDVHAGR